MGKGHCCVNMNLNPQHPCPKAGMLGCPSTGAGRGVQTETGRFQLFQLFGQPASQMSSFLFMERPHLMAIRGKTTKRDRHPASFSGFCKLTRVYAPACSYAPHRYTTHTYMLHTRHRYTTYTKHTQVTNTTHTYTKHQTQLHLPTHHTDILYT